MYCLDDEDDDEDEGDQALPYRSDDKEDDGDSMDDNDEYQQTQVLDYNHAMPYCAMDDARRYLRVWC